MRSKKGITLITLIITVVVLGLISGISITTGVNTYKESKVVKYETYMKVLQKKVDIILEEGTDFSIMGATLSTSQKETLQSILDNDTNNYIKTQDANAVTIRYFSSSDIEEYFDIDDVTDDIVINFANREVISLNGIEKDNVVHYVLQGL